MPFPVNPRDCEVLEAGFGDRLRAQRKSLGLTQEMLAAHLDVAVRSVKGYEAGSTTVASDVIYRMMAIGIDIGRLFYGPSGDSNLDRPPRIDHVALDRAITWVDGEWGNESGGQKISDRERIEWILLAYASVAENTHPDAEGIAQSRGKQRREKAG